MPVPVCVWYFWAQAKSIRRTRIHTHNTLHYIWNTRKRAREPLIYLSDNNKNKKSIHVCYEQNVHFVPDADRENAMPDDMCRGIRWHCARGRLALAFRHPPCPFACASMCSMYSTYNLYIWIGDKIMKNVLATMSTVMCGGCCNGYGTHRRHGSSPLSHTYIYGITIYQFGCLCV